MNDLDKSQDLRDVAKEMLENKNLVLVAMSSDKEYKIQGEWRLPESPIKVVSIERNSGRMTVGRSPHKIIVRRFLYSN